MKDINQLTEQECRTLLHKIHSIVHPTTHSDEVFSSDEATERDLAKYDNIAETLAEALDPAVAAAATLSRTALNQAAQEGVELGTCDED